MSCLVAITDGTSVWMGADSAAVDVENLTVDSVRAPKLLRKAVGNGGAMLIASSGTHRLCNIVQYCLPTLPSRNGEAAHAYMVMKFVPMLRKVLREQGYLKTDDSGVEGFEGDLLIGFEGHIFTVEENFHVSESVRDFDAGGSGACSALPVLLVTDGTDLEPFARLQMALETAAQLGADVAEPFTYIRLN